MWSWEGSLTHPVCAGADEPPAGRGLGTDRGAPWAPQVGLFTCSLRWTVTCPHKPVWAAPHCNEGNPFPRSLSHVPGERLSHPGPGRRWRGAELYSSGFGGIRSERPSPVLPGAGKQVFLSSTVATVGLPSECKTPGGGAAGPEGSHTTAVSDRVAGFGGCQQCTPK